MSEDLYEVAFSGRISAGENQEDVMARVAKMFNADADKLAMLFSGSRIVIKKNIDQQTAAKYQAALKRAGAESEVRPMASDVAAAVEPVPAVPEPTPESAPTASASVAEKPSTMAETGGFNRPEAENADGSDVAPAPQTDPLGITGDQIPDLAASVAPVGSVMQDELKAVPEPQFDFSELSVAPPGSDLDTAKKKDEPPPPDTSGLSMAD